MNIRQLEIFTAVYQMRHISKAAAMLHLTQPAVSKAIMELEAEYQVPLFERIRKKIYPTAAAEKLYAHAQETLNAFEQSRECLMEEKKTVRLRIGCTITLANTILPEVIARFQKEFPGAKLNVCIEPCQRLLEKLDHQELDLLMIEEKAPADYEQIPFAKDRLAVVFSRSHPLCQKKNASLEDLKNYPCVLRDQSSASRRHVDKILGARKIYLHPWMESVSNHALIAAVRNNLGFTILPEQMITMCSDLQSLHLDDPGLEREYNFVFEPEKKIQPAWIRWMDLCTGISQDYFDTDLETFRFSS